jgi:hypothetical protein
MAFKSRDEEHLDLLAIFHYVMAGLNVLGVCAGGVYVVVGLALAAGGVSQQGGPDSGSMMLVGGGIAAVGLFVTALIGVWTFLTFLAGRKLAKRQGRIFIMVIAALQLLSIPMGTILGIFTLVVLSRPSVVAMFEGHGNDEWRSLKAE